MRALLLWVSLGLCGCVFSYDSVDASTKAAEGGALIAGRVTDAETGKPVEGALIATEPPTGTTTTNSQGAYSIKTPPLTNPVTLSVVADKPGQRQRASACVTVSPEEAVSADVQLLSNTAEACASPCTDGNICLGGICATACHPVCACDERCDEGRCVFDASRPATGAQCPDHAHRTSSGLSCVCDAGFFSSGGRCVASDTGTVTDPSSGSADPTPAACPPDTVQSATGCVRKPLLGDWHLELDLVLDMDENPSTFSDRTNAHLVWELTVYDVTPQGDGWHASFGGGRQVSLVGTRITGPSDIQAEDLCSDTDELFGGFTLESTGQLWVDSPAAPTGLRVCARVDRGPAKHLFILDGTLTFDGFSDSFSIDGPRWIETVNAIHIVDTSGTVTVAR